MKINHWADKILIAISLYNVFLLSAEVRYEIYGFFIAGRSTLLWFILIGIMFLGTALLFPINRIRYHIKNKGNTEVVVGSKYLVLFFISLSFVTILRVSISLFYKG